VEENPSLTISCWQLIVNMDNLNYHAKNVEQTVHVNTEKLSLSARIVVAVAYASTAKSSLSVNCAEGAAFVNITG